MRLQENTDLLASAGKATGLAVLVDGVGDPVDPGVAADLYFPVKKSRNNIRKIARTALWLGSTRMTS